jgi:hypothetical protein
MGLLALRTMCLCLCLPCMWGDEGRGPDVAGMWARCLFILFRRDRSPLFITPFNSLNNTDLPAVLCSFILEIHNALVISGKRSGFFWGGALAGTFTQCMNAIPKLHPRHNKTSAVTPELAAKTSRKSSDGLGLSFGAQVAKMRLYFHSTKVLRCDWKPKSRYAFLPDPIGDPIDLPYCLSCPFPTATRSLATGSKALGAAAPPPVDIKADSHEINRSRPACHSMSPPPHAGGARPRGAPAGYA